MIENRRVSAVIPARGGSKGFPGKNLAKLAGRSLMAHAIAQAREAAFVDEVIVSSDAREILDEAERCGADIILERPDDLATDTASTDAVTMQVLDQLQSAPDYIVLLQVTTPLRRAEDIDAAIQLCQASGAPACVSVTLTEKSPFWMYRRDAESRLQPLFADAEIPSRRQDAPPIYLLNGAVYVAETEAYRQHGRFLMPGMAGYVMPADRSVDIDSPEDLYVAEAILQR